MGTGAPNKHDREPGSSPKTALWVNGCVVFAGFFALICARNNKECKRHEEGGQTEMKETDREISDDVLETHIQQEQRQNEREGDGEKER